MKDYHLAKNKNLIKNSRHKLSASSSRQGNLPRSSYKKKRYGKYWKCTWFEKKNPKTTKKYTTERSIPKKLKQLCQEFLSKIAIITFIPHEKLHVIFLNIKSTYFNKGMIMEISIFADMKFREATGH